AALPGAGVPMTIASKSGAAGNIGWEMRVEHAGASNYNLTFVGSLDGVNMSVLASSPFTLDTTTFRHYVVTWDRGNVAFFVDGVARGVGLIGTFPNAMLHSSGSPLRLGNNTMNKYLNGTLDEVRISQSIRWSAPFTVPNAEYMAD